VKHGLLRKRLVAFSFVRAKLLFQYQTMDPDTRALQNDFKAFPLDAVVDVKSVLMENGNSALGLVFVMDTNDIHRLDASSPAELQRWLAAIESVRAIRDALLRKENARRTKLVESQNAEMLQRTERLKTLESKKASFHQERIQKRAEQREVLRAKYQLSSSSSGGMAAPTAAS